MDERLDEMMMIHDESCILTLKDVFRFLSNDFDVDRTLFNLGCQVDTCHQDKHWICLSKTIAINTCKLMINNE